MPTFDSIQVTGNATIGQDLQVNGNETVMQNFNVLGNQTITGSSLINGSQTVSVNIGAGSTVSAAFRMVAQAQPTVPMGGSTPQLVHFYAAVMPSQPGLVLKGTDGNNYVLFVDVSGGTPTLALMLA
ncbi:hypothetical protein [Paenibacillus sp. XY044]|uniref:hypothetical protein n=1 Tax=Paenibacillus sp. XY044 TaxID=2026089 RepID=UPI000B997355|nr:hypothetical protein [Paenibacillus sp. XY044]OZB98299.1 hypothetical protein CJP46_03830 [Paenibacillus sp. XY044]